MISLKESHDKTGRFLLSPSNYFYNSKLLV